MCLVEFDPESFQHTYQNRYVRWKLKDILDLPAHTPKPVCALEALKDFPERSD